MCLLSKEGKKKATCDIVCYKAVLYYRDSGKYYTPIMFFPLSDAVVSGKRVYWASGNPDVEMCPDLYYKVQGGYIHVYKEIPSPKGYLLLYCAEETRVYECVIPKGTEYWKSYDGMDMCARKIRFVRRVV